ncbi:MAG TPA: ABC transporter substrate-binding protein [bacterium]|nr:ABC transporter substrate-binding protein [bacterium]
MAAVLLFICGSVLAPPLPAASMYPMVVIDALGRTVTLRTPPQRIISVAPSVTEILFALGLDRRIVGISAADDYPPDKVGPKTKVGNVVLDAERILRLRPDLILGVASLQRAQLERLIALRQPVFAVDARTLPEVYEQIALIGRLTERAGQAASLVAGMRRRERAVERAVAGRTTVRVYVEIWGEPLMTAGQGTFITDLVNRAGGQNVFADVHGWPQVSEEAVVRRNPDVIVVTYPQGRGVLTRRGWQRVNAVRAQRVGVVSPSLVSRPGPRLVAGLERLARIIHPEAFR